MVSDIVVVSTAVSNRTWRAPIGESMTGLPSSDEFACTISGRFRNSKGWPKSGEEGSATMELKS
jgi:hypothetical protein